MALLLQPMMMLVLLGHGTEADTKIVSTPDALTVTWALNPVLGHVLEWTTITEDGVTQAKIQELLNSFPCPGVTLFQNR